jgi:CRP-like cAMP-binding protein
MLRQTASPQDFTALAAIAQRLELFSPLKGGELDGLLSRLQLYTFASGETIFRRGDLPDAFYIVLDGEVRIELKARWFGLLRQVSSLKPGDLFGEMALLNHQPRSATATARGATRLFVMFQKDFEALLKGNPTFATGVRWLAERRTFEAGR